MPHFESFFDAYNSIDHNVLRGPGGPLYAPPDEEGNRGEVLLGGTSNANLDLAGAEVFYELAHMKLEQYEFGEGTLVSELLVDYYPIEESLYPLIEVLTPAEYAMMHLCGPLYMILATAMTDDVYMDYSQRVDDMIAESGKCSVWEGVDAELLRSSIGITDNASRAITETKAQQEFCNQGDSTMDTVIKTAGFFASHLGVAQAGVCNLVGTPDVVQQTGGDENIMIHIFLFGDFQGVIQHPVNVLAVMGTVCHGGTHISFDGFIKFLCHTGSSFQDYSYYSTKTGEKEYSCLQTVRQQVQWSLIVRKERRL
jgi:hypothetical protein